MEIWSSPPWGDWVGRTDLPDAIPLRDELAITVAGSIAGETFTQDFSVAHGTEFRAVLAELPTSNVDQLLYGNLLTDVNSGDDLDGGKTVRLIAHLDELAAVRSIVSACQSARNYLRHRTAELDDLILRVLENEKLDQSADEASQRVYPLDPKAVM